MNYSDGEIRFLRLWGTKEPTDLLENDIKKIYQKLRKTKINVSGEDIRIYTKF